MFLIHKDDHEKNLQLYYTNSEVLKVCARKEKEVKEDKIIKYELLEGKTGLVAKTGHLLIINYYGTSRNDQNRMQDDYKMFNEREQSNECLVEYLKDDKKVNVGLVLLLKIREKENLTAEDKKDFRFFALNKCLYTSKGLDSGKRCETSDIKDEDNSVFTRSFIAAALTVGEEVFGVLRIPRTIHGKIFSGKEIDFMKLIIDRLCLQLESEKYLNKINEINKLIGSSGSLNEIYTAILEAATDILGFEFAAIQLADYKKNLIWTQQGRKNSTIDDAIDPNKWIPEPIKKGIDMSELISNNKILVREMKGYGLNPISPLGEKKRDIHAWLLEEHNDDEVVSGWHDNFDRIIYRKYNHDKLISPHNSQNRERIL